MARERVAGSHPKWLQLASAGPGESSSQELLGLPSGGRHLSTCHAPLPPEEHREELDGRAAAWLEPAPIWDYDIAGGSVACCTTVSLFHLFYNLKSFTQIHEHNYCILFFLPGICIVLMMLSWHLCTVCFADVSVGVSGVKLPSGMLLCQCCPV